MNEPPSSDPSVSTGSPAWQHERTWVPWIVAPALGLLAMVLPVVFDPPVGWYDAPLFPIIRNAQEHFGVAQIVLLLLTGLLLGSRWRIPAFALGGAAISLLPITALAEKLVDPSSHNLIVLEFLLYAVYAAIVAAGAGATQKATEWLVRD